MASAERLDGRPFWLAAHLRPPPGAHLYWKNPGETGLGTTAEFASTDPSYEVSEARYPGPRSFASTRGAVGYGYEGDTFVLALVTPSAATAEAEFVVRASWLSCDAVCVQERGTARLELSSTQVAEPAHLEDAIARLPVPAAVETEWASPTRFTLSAANAQLVEFFPVAPLAPGARAPRSSALSDGRLLVELDAPPEGPNLAAVLRVEKSDAPAYFEVELPTPNEPQP